MNDDQITQSVNNLVSQAGDPTAQATPNLGLGSNPSDQQFAQSTQPQQPQDQQTPSEPAKVDSPNPNPAPPIDSTQTIDHGALNIQAHSTGTVPPELEEIKREALSQLQPMVDKLDQPPEEKYRTLMMMIQASDDQSLIKSAYDAANQINDDTKRAEALLGIVNEINYFSKNSSDQLSNQAL